MGRKHQCAMSAPLGVVSYEINGVRHEARIMQDGERLEARDGTLFANTTAWVRHVEETCARRAIAAMVSEKEFEFEDLVVGLCVDAFMLETAHASDVAETEVGSCVAGDDHDDDEALLWKMLDG